MNSPSPLTSTSTIAILPWGNVIEDFLDNLNLSLDDFCNTMTGGWLFGYIEALKLVNVVTVLICISSSVSEPTRRIHSPTGATIWLLPVSKQYLSVTQQMANPYGWTVDAAFDNPSGIRRLWSLVLREIAPYLCTPLGAIANILKEEDCQAILCQEYEYARFDLCVLLGRRLNIPVYASFQGGNFQLTKSEKLWRSWSIKACDGFIVASSSEIERLRQVYGVSKNKVAQIFNPLDVCVWDGHEPALSNLERRFAARAELGIPNDAIVVVWHGRVDLHRKGLDVLIKAWQQLCHQRHDNHLLLVGTGSDALVLRDRIDKMRLPRIHWVNEYILDRQRVRDYLRAADFYTLPSRNEGFPVAPLEAMACGLPIIATDVPGIADILKNANSGGIRVPCEDANQLAIALEHLSKDRGLRQRMGRQARQRIESEFSLQAVGTSLRGFIFPDRSAL